MSTDFETQHHVFVSYPHGENASGWVTQLVTQLDLRVNGMLDEESVHFWIDFQLDRSDSLTEQIRDAIRKSSLFLMIGSPRFLKSEWCKNKELPDFMRQEFKGRIFIVEKRPFDRKRLPAVLQDQLTYEFWTREPLNERWREFGEPVSSALSDPDYQAVLNYLSQDVAAKLKKLSKASRISQPAESVQNFSAPCGNGDRNGSVSDPAGQNGTPLVFLAESTRDLGTQRQAVKSYLTQAGVEIIEPVGFPGDEAGYRRMLVELLQPKGIIFAQLLDDRPGPTLDDALTRVVWLQWDVARKQRLPILQWRSPVLDPGDVSDQTTRTLLEESSVQAVGLEEFKCALKLAASNPPPRVVVSRDVHHDESVARSVASTLEDMQISYELAGIEENPDSLRDKLGECEALIFVHGAASEKDLHRHFQHCNSILLERIIPYPKLAILHSPPPPKDATTFQKFRPQVINCLQGFDSNKIGGFLATLPLKSM
jgi:TIR domain